MTERRRIEPIRGPIDAEVVLPGSKSLTNRALLAAALGTGRSELHGALAADDTVAMREALGVLGATIHHDEVTTTVVVDGLAGILPDGARTLDARQSGTTARFLLTVLATGPGTYHLTGDEQLQARPLPDARSAVEQLGAALEAHAAPDRLPVTVHGGSGRGAHAVRVRGAASSQLISGLVLAGPLRPDGLRVEVDGPLVSRPYVDMTCAVLDAFGATATWDGEGALEVAGGGYRAATYQIEPDASAASYLFAAAAVCGGRVRVPGLGAASLQGDLAFARVLEQMGAEVHLDADGTEVRGTGALHGVEVDLRDLSDTAPTLAVVASLASGPTRISGIGFIREKESDRVGNVARELRRCGIRVDEEPDGLVVHPGPTRPAAIETYRDHRMAMSFAVLGLAAEGIEILDPGCVGKTFPTFFEVLDSLRPA